MNKQTHPQLRIEVEDSIHTARQKEARFYYPSKPSWKNHGEGYATGRLRPERDGSLYCIFSEVAKGDKRDNQKEVFLSIPAEIVMMIKAGELDYKAP